MTSTVLKLIALITMLIDHIWAFIPNTPYYFHWIGRISAPIFTYCCVLGITNTKDKKKYLMRLYVFSLLMGVVNYILDIQYNFIRTLLLISIIIFIVEKFKSNDKYANKYLIAFIMWQVITFISILILSQVGLTDKSIFLLLTVFLNISILDGGILFVLIGLLMYFYRNSKFKLSISFIAITCLNLILYNTNIIRLIFTKLNHFDMFIGSIYEMLCKIFLGVHPAFMQTNLLYEDPQWMMIFSLPFILMYNQEKGRGFKYLFYIFYPTHIIILYFIARIFF